MSRLAVLFYQNLLGQIASRKPRDGFWRTIADWLIKKNIVIRKQYKNDFFIDLVDYYEPLRANGWYKHSEIETQNWIIDNVEDDWVIFDCGAHIGYYSMLFSYCAPHGKVYAFEANNEAIEKFDRNLVYNTEVFDRDFHNIELVRTALGNQVNQNLKEVLYFSGKPIPDGGKMQDNFSFITLDYFCDLQDIERLDLIKSDIDSWDYELLLGAEKTIDSFRPLIIAEINEELKKRNYTEEDVKRFLDKIDYSYQLLDYPSPTNWLMIPNERL